MGSVWAILLLSSLTFAAGCRGPQGERKLELVHSEGDHATADLQVLARLRELGADLTQPRHTLFYFYFDSEDAAKACGERLKTGVLANERDVVVRVKESDGGEWVCIAEAQMIVNEEIFAKLTPLLGALGRELGGEYDGWEAASKPWS